MEFLAGASFGFILPFTIYGIYKAYQRFIKPSDLKAVLERLPHETERLTQEAIKEVCSPVNRN